MARRSFRLAVLILLGFLCLPAFAYAQTTEGTSGSQTITVTGYGISSLPAEAATLQIAITTDDYYSGPPSIPEVEATPGSAARASMGPILEVIERHDIVTSAAVVIPVPVGPIGRPTSVARLDLTISAPTQQALIDLTFDVARAAGEDRMVIGAIGAWFEVTDCASLEQSARQNAMADAQRRAEVQAAALGTSLDAITTSTDLPTDETALTYGYYGVTMAPGNNCAAPMPEAYRAGVDIGVTLPVFDPVSQSPLVEVYREIQVTYSTAGPLATPAA